MKKPSIFIFDFINPLKKGIVISSVLNLTKKDYCDYYFLFEFIFFHFYIDFYQMYLSIRKIYYYGFN